MKYSRDQIINNLNTFEFNIPNDIFHYSKLNPENNGYCDENGCLGQGVFNVSKCTGGRFKIYTKFLFLF